MSEELHTEIRRAKQAWLNALHTVGDDPTKQPHSESPISVDISAFGIGIMKLQKAICDRAQLIWAKAMGIRSVALPKDDQRRVAYLSRRKNVFAGQLLLGCPDSQVPFKPLEFQVAVQRAFGVPLTFR